MKVIHVKCEGRTNLKKHGSKYESGNWDLRETEAAKAVG